MRGDRRVRWRTRVVLSTAAVAVSCLLYGVFVEPAWLDVTHTRVATHRLPPAHRGIRIVHLSDLHSERTLRLEADIPERVAALAPDLIVFTGDAANSPAGVAVFRACLSALARIAPTFVVAGNWDVVPFPEIDRFGGTGATVLDGTFVTVAVDGARVHVAGAAHGAKRERLDAAIAALPGDGPAIVLHHMPYPDMVPAASASRVDLMCAGHVHGGQIAVPFYGAVVTLSKHGKRFERGLYPDAGGFGFPLYVNRGIGLAAGPLPMRFSARPEIALIQLVPGAR
jgi:uncharacterized protein